MTAVVLHRIDRARNTRRFYRLDVQPDLFGWWVVVREWGRIGTWGQMRETSFATFDEAHMVLQRQRRAKEKRGYLEIEGPLAGEIGTYGRRPSSHVVVPNSFSSRSTNAASVMP